ncbi:glycogen/starch/alpha-glucan phosphorylase [Teredinibacter haidensis]|uniref:glycogen/starch/alpha-glucan phosphorylase n=1 Tax=Teredinibacter haidensis TaxID=2731755 RepID=UPI0009489027|nr:glycogen/starch/alpha-glucan phosphorylase [Teredinibacter haidensis]
MDKKLLAPVLSNDHEQVAADLHRHFNFTLGRFDTDDISGYMMTALALTVRDRLMERWRITKAHEQGGERLRKVYYLSLEFLLGRSLGNAILNLNMQDSIRQALSEFSAVLEDIEMEEKDAGLGNGGLGRLAACFMDSCATLALPVIGYGIRYEYGMFQQSFHEGRQVEQPDHWLIAGNPWEIERTGHTRRVKFYGYSDYYHNDAGKMCVRWSNTQDVLAVPYDMPIPGYKNDKVNTLRLWKATATDEFNLQEFNEGDYADAVAQKNLAEQITMVLYPNDSSENGKELRLRQQYFLASASLQDVIADWVLENGENFEDFAKYNCFQLNDTHPTLAVAELMRLLMDDHGLTWDESWKITTNTMAYTNHTLLPEALERWSVKLLRELLPRLLDIIYEINARFLAVVAHRWPGDVSRQQRMSIIEEGGEPQVRMAYMAIVGSFSVNGVAALHSHLLTTGLFKDFYELWPEKFNNKTNGVTPRRWLAHCNRGLGDLFTESIGPGWKTNLSELENIRPLANDAEFRKRWQEVKRQNKERLLNRVSDKCNVGFSLDSIFDVQVKRIHEYKRQLLNILHVIHLYDRITRGDGEGIVPRSVLLGGKAAPGYALAKLIIKLANNVAQVVNSDSSVSPYVKLAFLPNYRVKSMEIICPGTDLSEQISTAGKEASGTGNMKFMMNGALTIGTYDGANIEILDAVGSEHFFLFGLRVEDVAEYRLHNNPNEIIEQDEDLKRVMRLIECGHFSMFEPGIFEPIIQSIRNPMDPWMVAADFRSYVDSQKLAAEVYKDQDRWLKSSILNTSASGYFSSDRTIQDYARDIWKL